MDRTSEEMNRTSGKWIVHEVNIDLTSSKRIEHYGKRGPDRVNSDRGHGSETAT